MAIFKSALPHPVIVGRKNRAPVRKGQGREGGIVEKPRKE